MSLLFFFSIIQLTVGLCCCGARGANGAVERRHAAPAVVGRFIFFRDSAWLLTKTRVLPDTDGRTKPGSPP